MANLKDFQGQDSTENSHLKKMCFLTFASCVSMEHCKLYHILMPWKSEKSESLLLKGNLKLQIFCPINRKYMLTWLLLTWKSTLGLYDNGTSLASSNKPIMYLSSPIDNCKPIVHISSNSIWWSVTLTNRNKTPAQEEVMQGASAVAEPPGCVKKFYTEGKCISPKIDFWQILAHVRWFWLYLISKLAKA